MPVLLYFGCFLDNGVFLLGVQAFRIEETLLWCLCFSNSFPQILVSLYCRSCQKVAFTSHTSHWLLTWLRKDGCDACNQFCSGKFHWMLLFRNLVFFYFPIPIFRINPTPALFILLCCKCLVDWKHAHYLVGWLPLKLMFSLWFWSHWCKCRLVWVVQTFRGGKVILEAEWI